MSSQSYPRMSGPPLADSSTVPAVNLVSTASRTSGDKRYCASSSDVNVCMRDLDHWMSVRFNTLSAGHVYTVDGTLSWRTTALEVTGATNTG